MNILYRFEWLQIDMLRIRLDEKAGGGIDRVVDVRVTFDSATGTARVACPSSSTLPEDAETLATGLLMIAERARQLQARWHRNASDLSVGDAVKLHIESALASIPATVAEDLAEDAEMVHVQFHRDGEVVSWWAYLFEIELLDEDPLLVPAPDLFPLWMLAELRERGKDAAGLLPDALDSAAKSRALAARDAAQCRRQLMQIETVVAAYDAELDGRS